MEKVRDKLCGYIGEIDDYLFYDKKAMDKAVAYDEGVADGISQGIEQKTHDVAKEMILDKIDIDQ